MRDTRYPAWRAWAWVPAGHRWLLHKAQCPTGRSGQRSFLCVTAGRGHHSEPWPCSGEVRVALGAEEEDGPDFRFLVLPLSATSKPDGSFHLQLPQLPHRPSCRAGSRFQRSLPRPPPGQLRSSCCQPCCFGANGGMFRPHQLTQR